MQQDNVTYEYAVIRLVPKVEREEFINIGVILFSKRKKYLGIKYSIDEKRLQAFTSELDIDQIKHYLQAWDWVCQGDKQGGRIGAFDMALRFRWLVAKRSTIIQSSPTHPGLCLDPALELDKLFSRLVS